MQRRSFLKTVGLTAGTTGMAVGIPNRGEMDIEVGAAELPADGVELLTDEYDVSHVYGEDLYSVGFGQGYAQARDRLFQLDLLRAIGHGELSQIIGPGEVSEDISNTRDLYSRDELARQWEAANEDTREMIQGFTDGVNARMKEAQAQGEVPGEFVLLGRRLRAWEPLDTLAAIAYMIGRFGISSGAGTSNLRTLKELFDRVEGFAHDEPDLFPDRAAAWDAYGDMNSIEVPDHHYGSIRKDELDQHDEGTTPTGDRALSYDEVPQAQLDLLDAVDGIESWGVEETELDGVLDGIGVATGMFAGVGFGSNALVVDGEHTDTGEAMLGGGPQMGLFKPPVIHEIGLHGPEFDVVGVGVVGAPGVVVGRTPEFAWTVTTAGDSMTERIAVELDPEDHTRYEWDGEFHEFVTEEHVHQPNLWAGLVEGQLSPERVTQEVAYVEQEDTRMPVRSYNPAENIAFVERTATRMNELDGAFMWAEVGRADDREEFEETLSEFPFGFNFHLIDDDGIAYYRTGKIPRRSNETDPRFPTPEQYHEWDGFEEGILVAERAPDRGFVVNWNNGAAPGWRNSSNAFQWDGAQRVEVMDRLTKELIVETDPDLTMDAVLEHPQPGADLPLPDDARGNLTLEDVEAIIERCAVEHPYAPRFVPHIVAAARETTDEQLQAMADELEAWAETGNLGRFRERSLARWFETAYSFRPGGDGRYPNGGMAIYEAVRHELTDLAYEPVLGDRAPSLNFDATGGGVTGGEHAADHGTGGNSGMTLVNALERRTAFEWVRVHGQSGQSQTAALQRALEAAAQNLADTFDSSDPADWRLSNRQSEFAALGGTNAEQVPLTNRASYQQSIAFGQGEGEADHRAKSVLPPGNSGHVGTWELLMSLFGTDPDRMTTQLEMYANYEYKPQPIRRSVLEDRAVETTFIE